MPDLVGYFQQHFVPISFIFRRDEIVERRIMSAFVIEVSGYWFLVTAGHCLNNVAEFLQQGFEIRDCTLVDSLGPQAEHRQSIPFHYDDSLIFGIDEGGADYGVIHVRDLYRRMMVANGITALNEETWKKRPAKVDFYKLLGVPGQLTFYEGDVATITTTLHDVDAVDETEDHYVFDDVNIPIFYGRIELDEPLTSLGGMSGGPIFAFREVPGEGLKYWLHAVQSRWYPPEKLVGASFVQPLGDLIAEAVATALEVLEQEKPGSETEPRGGSSRKRNAQGLG